MDDRTKRLIVNAITFGRVPFVVLFMVLAVAETHWPTGWLAVVATVSLVVASLTDLYDGKLARKWNVVTRFGAMADPLMDKVFYLVVFPTLLWALGRQPDEAIHALVMLVFTVLYILRDQWVTFLRSVGSLYNADCGANWLGKFRTAASFPSACVIYVYVSLHPFFLPQGLIFVIEAFLIFVNLWSIAVYTRQYLPYLKRALDKN
ncbi:MAG: CDP-alcohol phosphatidyltransferase family protein [Verrucomicrobiota bacterium]|jgi:CDP-diacylglycerol--glycerol-3-phosphate 3-phosphatidyltransferase|nr:CDP-alcohol phosphatidyltransferase family protein [Verrucomicrobiota bacterium]